MQTRNEAEKSPTIRQGGQRVQTRCPVPRRKSVRTAAVALLLTGLLTGAIHAQTVLSVPSVTTKRATATPPKPSLPPDAARLNSVKALETHIAALKANAQKHHTEREKEERQDSKAAFAQPPRGEAEEEENGTDYLEAHLFYLRQRAYPGDAVD